MSFQVTTPFVEGYKNVVDMLLQQRGSKLREGVDSESVGPGDRHFFEQIGAIVAEQRLSRHADTPFTPAPHARRVIDMLTFEAADLIDKDDEVRLLINPESSYSQAMAWAMGRAIDDEIITRATGNALTGHAGGTTTAHGAGQQIASTFSDTGAATASGLTVGKLREARRLLLSADVDPGEEFFIATRAQQVADLLTDDEVTSSDFNTVRALVAGNVDTFMGFKFLMTERLTNVVATDVTTVIAWARSGIKLAMGREPVGRISERDDKSYSTQVYYAMDLGATRMEEEKVIDIQCDESP